MSGPRRYADFSYDSRKHRQPGFSSDKKGDITGAALSPAEAKGPLPVIGELGEIQRALEHVHSRGQVIHTDVLVQVNRLIESAEYLKGQIEFGLGGPFLHSRTRVADEHDDYDRRCHRQEYQDCSSDDDMRDYHRHSSEDDESYDTSSSIRETHRQPFSRRRNRHRSYGDEQPRLRSYQEERLGLERRGEGRKVGDSSGGPVKRRNHSSTTSQEGDRKTGTVFRNPTAEAQLKREVEEEKLGRAKSESTTLRSVSLKYEITVTQLRRFNPKLNRFEADEELPAGTAVNLKPEPPASISVGNRSKSETGVISVAELSAPPLASSTTTRTTISMTPADRSSVAQLPSTSNRSTEYQPPLFSSVSEGATPSKGSHAFAVTADPGSNGLSVIVDTTQLSPTPRSAPRYDPPSEPLSHPHDDTVLAIAQMHRITPSALIRANPCLRQYDVGQCLPSHLELVIPEF